MNGTLSNIHVRHNVKYIASLWALDPIRDNKLQETEKEGFPLALHVRFVYLSYVLYLWLSVRPHVYICIGFVRHAHAMSIISDSTEEKNVVD
jgi:hypothetical protein